MCVHACVHVCVHVSVCICAYICTCMCVFLYVHDMRTYIAPSSLLQVDSIAAIFTEQLTEARHRGAFEMAYTGFQKLCRCLWSSGSEELQLKPASWVEELLESLQSTSLTRLLSITRRSAGLPFFMQVQCTGELTCKLHINHINVIVFTSKCLRV